MNNKSLIQKITKSNQNVLNYLLISLQPHCNYGSSSCAYCLLTPKFYVGCL